MKKRIDVSTGTPCILKRLRLQEEEEEEEERHIGRHALCMVMRVRRPCKALGLYYTLAFTQSKPGHRPLFYFYVAWPIFYF